MASVVGVNAVGGAWVPATVAADYKSLTDERTGLEWLAAGLTRERDLDELSYAVARINLGIRSR